MAYSMMSANSIVPQSRSISIQASKLPGTTAGSRPVPGTRSRPRDVNFSVVAAVGETPWPQMTCCRPALASWMMMGASPPGPFRWGSATWSVKPAATAASKALPPRSSTAMPTWLAIQWVVATTPKVAAISGRVVNMRWLPFSFVAGG